MSKKPLVCRAIFFDAGQTLFCPNPSVGAIYARVASHHSARFPATVLEERFHRQWQDRGGLASLRGPATPQLERRWWHSLVKDVFREIIEKEKFDKFFDELYHTFGQAESWRLFPEVKATLATLRKRGFRMGIISNWDSRLSDLCRDMGLDPYFDFILISAVIGHSKPGEKIFRDALDLVHCEPYEAVHVGDSYDEDYKAALGAGLQAIFLDRQRRCKQDIPRITNVKELITCVRMP